MAIQTISPEEVKAFASPEELKAFWEAENPYKNDKEGFRQPQLNNFFAQHKAKDPHHQLLMEKLIDEMIGRDLPIFELKIPAYFSDDGTDSHDQMYDLAVQRGDFASKSTLKKDLPHVTAEDIETYAKRIGTFQNVGNLLGLLTILDAGFPIFKEDYLMFSEMMDCFDASRKGKPQLREVIKLSERHMAVMYDSADKLYMNWGSVEEPSWIPYGHAIPHREAKESVHTYDMAIGYPQEWVLNYIKIGVRDFARMMKTGKSKGTAPVYQHIIPAYERLGFFKAVNLKYLSNPPRLEQIADTENPVL